MLSVRYLRRAVVGVVAASLVGLTGAGAADKPGDAKAPDKAAVERARQEVKKLDDLYKTAVVGITKTYVTQQFDTPAAKIAADVFMAMKAKGYHNARLVDATGKPKNDENVAKTGFEKKAVQAMKDGKTYLEEVGEADGRPVLRAATVVPAVMKACAGCHGKKEGDLLGTLVYEIPIR